MAEDDDLDNPRDVELSSLTAIYPEIQQPKPNDPYTIALDLPVTPSKAVVVFFPAASDDATRPEANNNHPNNDNGRAGAPTQVDSHEITHLPSLHLQITFGPKYPADDPPRVTISTTPPWLPADTVKRLEEDGTRLWEEMGRDIVGFTYIDHLQQEADQVFGLVGDKDALEVDPSHKISILDYDIQARRAAFEKETFECGVCLDPKKGTACHRMLDCGHVFCVECLQDFYNNAIKEGDLTMVRCPAPNCAKEREKKAAASSGKKKKAKTFISPSELLQIPLDQETVKRYVTLKYKTELESDKNTVYCPRQWCNGAARSKKHKKPQGFELAEASDDDDSASDEDEDEDENHANGEGKSKPYKDETELLSICEECSFAFCSRCLQSWHGEFVECAPPREKGELSAEEIASLEYMKLHTTPCPTCAAPAQKTRGCNHMICYRCQTHFCYLCSAWLDPGNPYQHFNEMPDGRVTGCYMRLWELEFGDGDDVGRGFRGGVGGAAPAAAAAVPPAVAPNLIPEIEEPDDEVEEVIPPAAPEPPEPPVNGGQVGIAREGPLVLRIAANPTAGAGRGGPRGRAAPVAAAAGPVRGGAGGRGRGGGGVQAQGGGRRGGRGGRRAGAAVGQRGGGRGGGVGGLPHHRQNNQPGNQAQQQRRINVNNNNNPNQNGGRGGGGGLDELIHDFDHHGHEVIDPAHEAWIQHFVRLALNDEEDILFISDDDDDDDDDVAMALID
ncbi:translation termination inhibitor protein itt1 [Podospora fimiseda]|uniref:RBR-type E3 ubiquitin transferase n=1 Tax=Podospora fimiseda TaxID=252190 RepID=A0AAN7GW22_9PEZI|nr:translation termination inhibitor protein itt1 [Podospora fimiseda]